MRTFKEIYESNKVKKYEYYFQSGIGYVIDKDSGEIIIYSNMENGQEYLKLSVEKMNK